MLDLVGTFQERILSNGTARLLDLGIAFVLVFVLYILIKLLVKKVENRIMGHALEVTSYTKKMATLVGNILFIVLMMFNVLVAFEVMGINTAILIGGLTIGIGFAMDETIGNMVAGIMIITSGKIKVGQSIKLLGDINQIVRIQEFHIRYTVAKNLYKQQIIIPNLILLDTPIQTKNTEKLLRGEVILSVGRQYNLDLIKHTIVTTINANEYIIQSDQTIVLVKSFNAKGYELVCHYYYSPTQGKKTDFSINSDLRRDILQALKQKDIEPVYKRLVVAAESDL